jgi:hypothetical protein
MANEDKRATLLTRLQTAIELEWSTIPPYMVAILSTKLTANREAANLIRGVMMEEMLHMALVANVLNAVGGTVYIGHDNVPSYPHTLFKDRDFPINLAPFSAENVATFMKIEEPRTSVGVFYRSIVTLLEELEAAAPGKLFTGDPARQLYDDYYWGAGNQIIPVKDLDSAKQALDVVISKGEGAGEHPPFTPDAPLQMAHYYRFAEIYYQRRYLPADDPAKPPTGPALPVDYSAVYPIKVNPKAADYAPGSKLAELNDAFNSRYTMMLRQLEQALTGLPKVLYTAIMNGMHGSTSTALEMMTTPIPGDPEGRTGCPTFDWLDKAIVRT